MTQAVGQEAPLDKLEAVGNRLVLDTPRQEDGASVHKLIASCPPLDQNSLYANLLQCTHFADTCVAARQGSEIVGWVSGFITPKHPGTYFLWQVAVGESGRGQGLSKRMIATVLSRPVCRHVMQLQTTITRDNEPSWRLFERVADALDASLSYAPHFDRDRDLAGQHPTELLVTIGPFGRASTAL